jgi:RNA polymerase sigma factor (sigma-70 family)
MPLAVRAISYSKQCQSSNRICFTNCKVNMKSNSHIQNHASQLDKKSGPAYMYNQLKTLDPTAVSLLCEGIKQHLQLKKHRKTALAEDLEELANDAAVLVLRKICDGTYSFFGVSPMYYAHSVADNLLRNFCRKKHWNCLELNDAIVAFQQPEVEAYFTQEELKNQVENALSKLSEPRQLVIRLKYFEDLKDEEIVGRGLAPHRSTDSLKSARCRSLKQLAGFMKEE